MDSSVIPLDVEALRRQAREHVEGGAVTAGYSADRDLVIDMLGDALATELVCMLRYRRHHFMANGIHAPDLAREFLEHANEELEHADLLARPETLVFGPAGEQFMAWVGRRAAARAGVRRRRRSPRRTRWSTATPAWQAPSSMRSKRTTICSCTRTMLKTRWRN